LRPGLPVLDRRSAERQHGAGLLHLQQGISAEPGRPCRRRRGDALRDHRRHRRSPVPAPAAGRQAAAMTASRAQRWNLWAGMITAVTIVFAVIWAFPLYWAVVSSLKPEDEV